MIDRDGTAPVGSSVQRRNEFSRGKRVREHSWQFHRAHQARETPSLAMYRDLHEEVGLNPEHVRILGARATGCATTCPING